MDVETIERFISTKEITYQEALEVYAFFKQKVADYESEDLLDLMVRFQKVEEEIEVLQTRREVVFFNMVIVKAFLNSSLPWRARKYALKSGSQVYQIVQEEEDFFENKEDVKSFAGILVDLGSYFNSILNFGYAASCFHACCEYLFKCDAPLRDCAWAKRKEVIARKNLGRDFIYPSDEEINKTFKEYAKGIIEIIHGKGFTWRDPIESTEVFQKAYDEVKEQVLLESKALREKNMKVDNDELFKKAMKQRGISWKPPVKMEDKKSLFKRK